MQYQIGDQVVHTPLGLGQVVGLINSDFGDAETKLYYEIALDKSTVWVPVQAPPSVELRALTHKRDLEQYRHVLRSKPEKLSGDHRQRRSNLVESMKTGTFEALCTVVRDLSAQGQVKTLNNADSLTLRQARTNLTREWAVVAEISLVEAIRHIESLILEGRLALGPER